MDFTDITYVDKCSGGAHTSIYDTGKGSERVADLQVIAVASCQEEPLLISILIVSIPTTGYINISL